MVFTAHALESATNRLNKQEKIVHVLKDTVSSQKKELDLLNNRFNRAEKEIQTHEKCIIRLMDQDDENKDSEIDFEPDDA